MHATMGTILRLACGLLGVAVTYTWAAEPSAPAPSEAQIVEIQGATTTYQSRDMHGNLVEIEVPTTAPTRVRTGATPPANASGTVDGAGKTVEARVVAIDTLKHTATVQTQRNQTLTIQLPADTLATMQIGEQLTLVLPH